MSKTVLFRIGVLILLLSMLFSGTAFVQEEDPDNPQSIPNGPWIQPEQTVNYVALMSNEELFGNLFQIEARSKGRMKVELAGHTGSWPIYVVKFGEADPNKTRVLIESQIHGGEPLGTEAVVFQLLKIACTETFKKLSKLLSNLE